MLSVIQIEKESSWQLGVLFRYLSRRTGGNRENSHLHLRTLCEWRFSAVELRYFNGLFFYVLVMTLRLVPPALPFHAVFSSFLWLPCFPFLPGILLTFILLSLSVLFFFPLHLPLFLSVLLYTPFYSLGCFFFILFQFLAFSPLFFALVYFFTYSTFTIHIK
jgi:hypothetical protein